MKRITNNFTIKLTEKEILPETLNLILAPFSAASINIPNKDLALTA